MEAVEDNRDRFHLSDAQLATRKDHRRYQPESPVELSLRIFWLPVRPLEGRSSWVRLLVERCVHNSFGDRCLRKIRAAFSRGQMAHQEINSSLSSAAVQNKFDEAHCHDSRLRHQRASSCRAKCHEDRRQALLRNQRQAKETAERQEFYSMC